jgi:hypothetical protein
MSGSNSTLSTIDGQQAVAKRKEEDAAVAAQAATTTVHREQEALIDAMAAARKTLDKALMLLTLRRYALDGHILSDITDSFVYWTRVDNIVVTWILGTLSPELHEIVREPTEIARQAWLAIETQFFGNSESRVLQLDTSSAPSSKETSALVTTIVG